MRSMAGGEVRLFNVAGGTKDMIDALDQVNGVAGLDRVPSHAGTPTFRDMLASPEP